MQIDPALFALGEMDLDIWLCYDEKLSEAQLVDCQAILSGAEKAKGLRFAFEADRRRYLVARSMTRQLIGGYLGIHPSVCAFELNEYGKPFVRGDQQASPPISFNVSHTAGLIVLAVARQGSVGVDVENVSTRPAPLEIASQYFAPSEVAQLQSSTHLEKGLRFFEFWTLKEAYIKARGMGLSIPLQSFSFAIDEDGKQLRFSPPTDDRAQWAFRQLKPTHDHVIAVCVDARSHPVRLRTRRFVPGRSGFAVALPVSKQSNPKFN